MNNFNGILFIVSLFTLVSSCKNQEAKSTQQNDSSTTPTEVKSSPQPNKYSYEHLKNTNSPKKAKNGTLCYTDITMTVGNEVVLSTFGSGNQLKILINETDSIGGDLPLSAALRKMSEGDSMHVSAKLADTGGRFNSFGYPKGATVKYVIALRKVEEVNNKYKVGK